MQYWNSLSFVSEKETVDIVWEMLCDEYITTPKKMGTQIEVNYDPLWTTKLQSIESLFPSETSQGQGQLNIDNEF